MAQLWCSMLAYALSCGVVLLPGDGTASVSTDDGFTRAARSLEAGDVAMAMGQLEQHIHVQPQAYLARQMLAELHATNGDTTRAKQAYQSAIAMAVQDDEPPLERLAAWHQRLCDMAQDDGDAFTEQYHRGAGLYWISQSITKQTETERDLHEVALLSAVRALERAMELQPNDAGVALHLARVHGCLGQWSLQRSAAQRGVAMLPDPALSEREACELRQLSR